MGMADKRPKRMLMVVMFKAEHNQITQIWADLDKEGLGGKKDFQHGQSAFLGSARARPLRILGTHLAAPGGAALPGEEAGPLGAQPLPRVLEPVTSQSCRFHLTV